MVRTTRRALLKAGAALAVGSLLSEPLNSQIFGDENDRDKLPVAGVITEYRVNSHADVIIGKILEGYRQDGGRGPGLRLATLYVDQFPATDMSRSLSEKYGFRITSSIDEAITLGTNQVQVVGVLSIGEHGDYPNTLDTKQHMYPRRRFFDEIVASFVRCGKSVPVFNDKHIGYRWDDAKFMVDTAKKMNFPFLAGSSLPLTWRKPVVELPNPCEIESAIAIGYAGLEAYGFHALETLQCMIERRTGGESGIQSVQAVTGNAIAEAEKQGRWSRDLFDAALRTLPNPPPNSNDWMKNPESAVYLIQHRDGLKSAVVMANGLIGEFAFAVKLKNQLEPIATWFRLQPGKPFGHFAYLVEAFEQTILKGKAAYPVERTLMTTGVLDRVMHSLAHDGKLLETPELNFSYSAANWPFANHPKTPMQLPDD